MPDTVAELVAKAIAEGKVTRLPYSPPKPRADEDCKFHPEMCGTGQSIVRYRHLDELDGDRA